ncbi:DUF411 domain-containing protein [Neopusillimonas maritima]|jgi:hypothetical protein|uniref:CopG family transcriptional regulator n=1 Tax=Neopusillimonas maritima TaxID=2026239 RepID=A0A3A1YUK9_9BURK|nr:DUF411 domain-containing protein [Neopusillimonas maritima]RIY39757.1 CopG family transcriptional regulator [Neopusillimonas maritima]
MKRWILLAAILSANSAVSAGVESITVYQNPNCGCCSGWSDYMKSSGFNVTTIKTADVASHKVRLGVPEKLSSCHTAILATSGQIIEGHVPIAAVKKLLAMPEIEGVSAPGMPINSPGMGALDGNLVTLDFKGRKFSRD